MGTISSKVNRTTNYTRNLLIVCIIATSAVVTGCGTAADSGIPPSVEATGTAGGIEQIELTEISLIVPELDCAGCSIAIQRALRKIDGVDDVVGDSKNGSARVSYDPLKATPQQLIAAIEEAGFNATIATSEGDAASDGAGRY